MPVNFASPETLFALGYGCAAISLVLPAVEHGKTIFGLGCLALSIFSTPFLFDGEVFSFRWVIIPLTGFANLWLMMGWITLLFPARWPVLVSGIIGYPAFLIAILSASQVEMVYAGFFFWVLSFLLIATGYVREFVRGGRQNRAVGTRRQ